MSFKPGYAIFNHFLKVYELLQWTFKNRMPEYWKHPILPDFFKLYSIQIAIAIPKLEKLVNFSNA
jgi:hypothetical protein